MSKPELDGRVIPAEKVKHYDFSVKPIRGMRPILAVAKKIAVSPYIKTHDFQLEKINMEGLKPPYVLLCNHGSFVDFYALYESIKPLNPNFVVAIDAVRDVSVPVMNLTGFICKRKFVQDLKLIKHMKYVVDKLRNVVCLYPEARYSLDGTTSFLPESLGKVCKLLKVPVVTLIAKGNFVAQPQWNKQEKYIPLAATLSQIVTAEEVNTLSAAEINARIQKAFVYDDFAWQRENGYKTSEPFRANGLHSILYQCPHCKTEFEMYSEGTILECRHCGKKWEMTELSTLRALEGETEFSHIPDWFRWERENVNREIAEGRYCFDGEVEVHTLPNAKHFYYQGKGRLRQTTEGTTLECEYHGKPLTQHWAGNELESVHVEYDYPFKKDKYKLDFGDCIDISIPSESFWLHPVSMRDQLTKFSFATEEIYRLAKEKAKK
ncbi:MAG: 1-acyl-sn-glycerol-3-phosphate acyltransferase [Christensenellaceae bacterium]